MEYTSIPPYFQISSEEIPYAAVLRVAGEVDVGSAPSLKERLMGLIVEDSPGTIVVDFQSVTFLDMSGVRVLEVCHRRAAQQGLRFILVGSAPLVHKILVIVELDKRMPLVETMGEALEMLGRAG
ncbi:MAG TPA: STAS domain-containing protein [bacterium]|nr:STAS domain-containing protein [bacterium]